jgi:hypothetical protein
MVPKRRILVVDDETDFVKMLQARGPTSWK